MVVVEGVRGVLRGSARAPAAGRCLPGEFPRRRLRPGMEGLSGVRCRFVSESPWRGLFEWARVELDAMLWEWHGEEAEFVGERLPGYVPLVGLVAEQGVVARGLLRRLKAGTGANGLGCLRGWS